MASTVDDPDTLNALAAALRERRSIIADEASRADAAKHMQRLQAVSEKIEAIQARLPQRSDPRLRHFLERRSYDKALEWIEEKVAQTSRLRTT